MSINGAGNGALVELHMGARGGKAPTGEGC